jgi:hypothetical protein
MYLTVNKMYIYLTEQNVHLFDLTNYTCIINKQIVHAFDGAKCIYIWL